jgi:site-specific DNA recombinase
MKAAVYVRVSTVKQAEQGLSQSEQEKRCRDYIDSHGWEIADVYVETMSGTREDRPELERVLGTLDTIDCLVIVKLDRLGRNTRHLLSLYETLEAADVNLVSIGDNIDTTTPMGKVMRVLLSAFAQMESETTGERVRNVVGARAQDGRRHGAWPFGYKDGKANAAQAAIVRRIFQEIADGGSQREVANKLNAEGVKSAKGGKWGQPQIKAVLDNVTHIGQVESNGEVYNGKHEAIVSTELWDRVQTLRAANKRGRGGSSAGRKPKQPYLFTKGLLRCAHCGAAMNPHTTTSGHESYNCNTRKSTKADACEMRNVPRKQLDEAVFGYFEKVCVDIEATKQELQDRAAAQQAEVAARLKAADRLVAVAISAIETLDRDYAEGDIDGKQFQRLITKREAEQVAAEADLALLQNKAASVATEPQSVADTAEMISALRAEVAGEVKEAAGLDGVRARLSALFESFQIAVVADEGQPQSAAVQAVLEAQEREYADEPDPERIKVGGSWVVFPQPRGEWIGDLDGYWREILGPTALPINEALRTIAGY